MTSDSGQISDSVSVGLGAADEEVVVGNEMRSTDDGVNGPDTAQWPVEVRGEVEHSDGEPLAEGEVKGPDESEWGPAARAERGAEIQVPVSEDPPAPSE